MLSAAVAAEMPAALMAPRSNGANVTLHAGNDIVTSDIYAVNEP